MTDKQECITGDCKGKVKYECPECGALYCRDCAMESDYECSECPPPMLERINPKKK